MDAGIGIRVVDWVLGASTFHRQGDVSRFRFRRRQVLLKNREYSCSRPTSLSLSSMGLIPNDLSPSSMYVQRVVTRFRVVLRFTRLHIYAAICRLSVILVASRQPAAAAASFRRLRVLPQE